MIECRGGCRDAILGGRRRGERGLAGRERLDGYAARLEDVLERLPHRHHAGVDVVRDQEEPDRAEGVEDTVEVFAHSFSAKAGEEDTLGTSFPAALGRNIAPERRGKTSFF